jgi:hypothetical protein
VGGDPLAVEQAGGAGQEGAAAHGGDTHGCGGGLPDPGDQLGVLDRGADAEAARQQEGVDRRGVAQGFGVEGEAALGPHRAGPAGDEAEVVAAGAGVGGCEHLVGPDDVEGLNAQVGDDGDAVHLLRVLRGGVGVNAIIPTIHATNPTKANV